ncbi:hypothetical protein Tco_1417300 [Tanacetum coccineum]
MPLQQTFKSSIKWLRPHHTRLGDNDNQLLLILKIDRANHARLEQTSRADLYSRPTEQTLGDEGAAIIPKVVKAVPHSYSQLRSRRRHLRRNRS